MEPLVPHPQAQPKPLLLNPLQQLRSLPLPAAMIMETMEPMEHMDGN